MPPMLRLTKRDGEDFFLPKLLMVWFVVLCALVGTLLAYAVHRVWGFDTDDAEKELSPEQHAYMAEVRMRNLRAMEGESRRARFGKDRQGHV